MLETGIKGYLEDTVTEDKLASVFKSGTLPVYATPAMIALAEAACLLSVQPELEEGKGTVGTKVDIAHLASTPCGMKVHAETELTKIDRRRLVFNVKVYDEVDLIAEGTHERFIIDCEKFQAKTEAKSAK